MAEIRPTERDTQHPHNAALMLACCNSDVAEMQRYLQLGADPNSTLLDGWSTLHFAVNANCRDACDLLLAAKADPNLHGAGVAPVLNWAVLKDYDALCCILIRHGADVDAMAIDKRTPLDIAIALVNTALCALLLQLGAKADPGQLTAMAKLCAIRFDSGLAHRLLERGCEAELQRVISAETNPEIGDDSLQQLADFLQSRNLRRLLAASLAQEAEDVDQPLPITTA